MKRSECVIVPPPPSPPILGPTPSNRVTVQVWSCGLIVETVRQERCPLCNLFLSLLLLGCLWTTLSQSCPFVEATFKCPYGSQPRSSRSPFFLHLFIYLFNVLAPSSPATSQTQASLISSPSHLLFYESLQLNRFPALLCHTVSGGHIWHI